MKKLILPLLLLLSIVYSSIVTYKYVNVKPQVVSHTDTIPGDSVFTQVTILKPKPYKVTVHDTTIKYVPLNIDKCIQDYTELYMAWDASKEYSDTLKNDSSATVIVNSFVTRNTLDSLKMAFKNNRPTAIVTTTVLSTKYSIGLIAGKDVIMPIVGYEFKKNIGIIGGYNTINKSVNLGIKYNF